MQSFIQYHRFGKAAEQEHERDREKAATAIRERVQRTSDRIRTGRIRSSSDTSSNTHSTKSTQSLRQSPPLDRDIEKAKPTRSPATATQDQEFDLPPGCYVTDIGSARSCDDMEELRSQPSLSQQASNRRHNRIPSNNANTAGQQEHLEEGQQALSTAVTQTAVSQLF